MSSLRSAFRNHLHVIVVVSILLVVMTWPTIVYVFDTETFWLPTNGRDVWIEIWDVWHGRSFFAGETSLNYTDMLFYPHGMSLDNHPKNFIHIIVLALLQLFAGTSNAFNFVYLLIIFSTTLAGYVYLNYLFKNRWVALFGAVIFGFSHHAIGHANHPALNTLFTLPLSLYAMQRGINEQKRTWMLVSGGLLGVTALVGMYIFVCLLITLGLYVLFFTYSSWIRRKFWIGLIVLFGVAGPISLIQIYPMIRDTSRLNEALQKSAGQESNNDLLSFFASGGHPWLTPVFVSVFDTETTSDYDIREQHKTSYLGYIPLLLIALGLRSVEHRRRMIPWLFLILPFLILRLGSVLRINGEIIPGILLPKHVLNAILPAVFQAVWETDHFQIGVLLPLAVLSCFGLQVLLKSAYEKRRLLIVLVSIALVAFEYYQAPLSQVVLEQELAFINWLRTEPNQEEVRLINLPMGRRSAKLYGFHQTINSYPHVEGLARRTPAKSYDYIGQNFLLATWLQQMKVECRPDIIDSYLVAIDRLLRDGFSHVILHHRERAAEDFADSFQGMTPVYQDDYASIYRVRDLRDTCLRRKRYHSQFPHLNVFARSRQNDPRPSVTLMNLYPVASEEVGARQYFAIIFDYWSDLIHIAYDELGAVASNSEVETASLNTISADNKIIWLIYNPHDSDPRSQSEFTDWLAQNLRFCQQKYRSEDLAVEYYIDSSYPCELVVTGNPLEVRYDNGITLANLLTDWDADQLSINMWWQRGGIRGYAYTIQVFNEQGEKQSANRPGN